MGLWDTPPTADEVAAATKAPPTDVAVREPVQRPDGSVAFPPNGPVAPVTGGSVWDAPPTEQEKAAAAPAPLGGGVGNVSAGKAALKGVQDIPTAGFGDELGGAFQAALAKLSGDPQMDPAEVYRVARNENRAESKAAADQHPLEYYGAGAAAALPIAAATPGMKAAQGAGLLARMGVAGVNGLAQGALAGLGNSEAEDVPGAAKDALTGGLIGGGISAAFPLAGAGLKKAADLLDSAGINTARRAIGAVSNSMSNKEPLSEDAVRQVVDAGGLKPFRSVAETAERIDALRKAAAERYKDILATLEKQGVRGPAAEKVAKEWVAKAAGIEENNLNPALPAVWRQQAEALTERPGGAAGQRFRDVFSQLKAQGLSDAAAEQGALKASGLAAAPSGELGLVQAESIKRGLQNDARYGMLAPENTPLNEQKQKIASSLREHIEGAVDNAARRAPPNSPVATAAAQFVPAKQELGNFIAAGDAAEAAARRAMKNNVIGVRDMMATAKGGLPLGAAMNLARTRGTSAAAVGMLGAAKGIRGSIDLVRRLAQSGDGRLAQAIGPARAALLIRAMQEGGEDDFAVKHFLMTQSDPNYSQALAQMDEGTDSARQR